MPLRWRIALIWAAFLTRLAFYATILPLWEGYDEWAHFSVIRSIALTGKPLVARDQPVPRDVAQSLQLAPVPWELRSLPWPSVTEDAYWELGPEVRAQREAAFRAMPAEWAREDDTGGMTAYEALQPPLYYWMMAPILRLVNRASLATQVFALRWAGIAVASCIIPLIFGIARMALGEERAALWCTAAVAVMPGFAMDLARVGNECLAVVWFTLLIWFGLQQSRSQAGLGVVLGLGLLTKAYFLTAIPAVLLLPFLARKDRENWRRAAVRAVAPAIVAAAVAGWWYGRNLLTTGTFSGLSEAAMLREMGTWTLLRHTATVPWPTAIDAILLSHIYFGGWSSLTVRAWMYHVFYGVILLAAFGVLRVLRRPPIAWLAAVYAAFWAGQFYNVLLLYVSKGLPGSMGWYLYAVVAAEAVLCTAGLARIRRWIPAAGVLLLGLLDLYTLHWVATPYYVGLIRHKPGGAIAAFHLSEGRMVGIGAVLERLTAYKPTWVSEVPIAILWFAYLGATLWLMVAPGLRKKQGATDEHGLTQIATPPAD